MNTSIIINFILIPAIVGIVTYLTGVIVTRRAQMRGDRSAGPHVVVNVPADWKPMAVGTVAPEQIERARAQLWWTVYSATIKAMGGPLDTSDIHAARYATDNAMDTVFGPLQK